MTPTRTLTGAFGGSYLGVIAVKAPGMLGYSCRPTQKVELIAALIGLVLAGLEEPLKLGR